MALARRQGSTGQAAPRSVVPASNLFGLPNDSLVIDTPLPTRPFLAWPPAARAHVTGSGALHVVERGRVVHRFAADQWKAAGRLINLRPEHWAVVVIELVAGVAA